jgi:hypothetical protein
LDLTELNLLPSPRKERWPITTLELPEVNKPQARISGLGDFHSFPIHSNTCIEVTSGTLALDDFDSCQIEFKKNLFEDLTVQM